MQPPEILFAAVVGVGLVYALRQVFAETLRRYRAPKTLRCPETGQDLQVTLDTRQALLSTLAFGTPQLRVAGCSLWPEQQACGRRCLQEPGNQPALHTTYCPYSRCKSAARRMGF